MKIEHHKYFSNYLQRDMEFNVYGHAGKPCLVFPAQDGRYYDFENFKMIEAAQEYIDHGRIQFYCVDSIDKESWSDEWGNPRQRIEQHERWFHYICEELLPLIHAINKEANCGFIHHRIMTCGCSMGGTHAMNFFLRRPDLFDEVLSLSGIFNAAYFFHDYKDDLIYLNSPQDYMRQFPKDHPYMKYFYESKIIACVGQGEWEDAMIESSHDLEQILREKQIPAWFDYWGHDVSHDWPWWQKQLPYFLSFLV